MSFDLTDILACPGCRAPLAPPLAGRGRGDAIPCEACGARYPVVGGVPRFVATDAYAASFSFEWNRHRRTQLDGPGQDESERTFLAKTGLRREDVKDKLVLDVGCGMGRFADVASRWGARVVGVDLSLAVEAAQENIGHRENVALMQADIFALPFREESFDVIYSIGVLHHTPNCAEAFRQLPRYLRPGGLLAIWVYGHLDIWVRFADRYRRLTVNLPPRLLYALCRLAVPLHYVYKIPLLGYLLWILFPISPHPKGEWRVLDTFDWYSPRYQSKHTYPEVHRWFREAGLGNIELLDVPVAVRGRRPGGDPGGRWEGRP